MAFRTDDSPYLLGSDDSDFIIGTAGAKARFNGIALGGGGDDTILVGHGPVFIGLGGALDDPALWTRAAASYVDAGPTAAHTSVAIEGDGQTVPTYSITLDGGQTITLDLDFTDARFSGLVYHIDLVLDGQVVASADSGPADVGSAYSYGLPPIVSDPYLSYTAGAAGTYQIVVTQSFLFGTGGPFQGKTSLLNVSVAGHAATGTASAAPQIVDGGEGNDTIYAGAGADFLNGGAGSDVLNGGAGNDVLVGESNLFVDTGVANFAFDTPISLDDPRFWSTPANVLVGAAGPHTSVVSVQPDNATAEYDYYSVTVAAGQTITLDVDFASKPGDPLDLFLALFAADGTTVAYTTGGDADRGSDASGRDPALTFTAQVAGTYTILVGGEPGQGIPAGESYLLNVSVTGHAVSDDQLDTGTADPTFDVLTGGAGNDVLMAGGGYVDYSDAAGAVTVTLHRAGYQNTVGAGRDLIVDATALIGSAFDDTLAVGTPSAAAEGNILSGGAGNDQLAGSAGDDALYGGADNDRLVGGDGADLLDGGFGLDDLRGGLGDDRYFIDSDEDAIVETAGEGTDLVHASVAFVLPDNVENLILDGPARSGTGNALANVLTGSAGADTLSGLAGADTLVGGDGDDTLQGGSGADVLTGGAGNDLLIGGSGADRFVFAAEDIGADRSATDSIGDFSRADRDRIALGQIDAVSGTARNDAFTFIGSGAFTGTAGQLHAVVSGGVTYVEGDTNGDGAADFAIALAHAPVLVASDFVL